MRRYLTHLVIPAVALALAGGALATGTAHAAESPTTGVAMTLQNVSTGTFADVAGGHMADGQKIAEWSYQNARNQQWWLQAAGGHFKIKSNVNGAYCLARQADGNLQNVILRRCDTHLADWDFHSLGGDKWQIKDAYGPHYLNVWNGTPTTGRQLVQSTVNDYGGAQWYFADLTVKKRPMPADPRLDQVTFLTSHNAFANTDEGYWGRFPNQSYSLRSQLDQGIRGFQLDIYASGGTVKMCHNSCWFNERTLTSGLQTIVNYLNSNRSAVITVFLEDYTSVDQLRASVGAVNGIQDLLFYPDRAGVRNNGWPTVSKMVSDNKRLLIFSQRGLRESFGVFHDYNWTAENYWSLGSGGNIACYSRWNDVPLHKEESRFVRLHVMNQYRDIPSEGAANADNGGKLRDRAERICGPAARRKPNYVAVDFFQKPEGDPPRRLVDDLNRYW